MDFHIPTKGSTRLEQVLQCIYADAELHRLWKCANMNAADRAHTVDSYGESP